MSANAEETSTQATVVWAAAEQVTRNLQTVATSTEEMTASIKEIAKNASDAASVAFGGEDGRSDQRHRDQAGRVECGNRPGDQGDYFDCATDKPAGTERDD